MEGRSPGERIQCAWCIRIQTCRWVLFTRLPLCQLKTLLGLLVRRNKHLQHLARQPSKHRNDYVQQRQGQRKQVGATRPDRLTLLNSLILSTPRTSSVNKGSCTMWKPSSYSSYASLRYFCCILCRTEHWSQLLPVLSVPTHWCIQSGWKAYDS